MWPGDYGNGSNTRSGAARLHAHRADKSFFQLGGYIPRLPQLIIILLCLQKIGENCSFRNESLALCTVGTGVNSAVVRVNEHLKLMRIKSTLGAISELLQYVQNEFIHTNSIGNKVSFWPLRVRR